MTEINASIETPTSPEVAVVTSNHSPKKSFKWLGILFICLILIAALAVAGWYGKQYYETFSEQAKLESQRVVGLEQSVGTLRGDMRSQAQRISDAANNTRVLRDELLGLRQRGELLEGHVNRLEEATAKIADSSRQSAQQLRAFEVELLLEQGLQRVQFSNDMEGAIRAYQLAAKVLTEANNPNWLNIQQSLVQETNALEAVSKTQKNELMLELENVSRQLELLPLDIQKETPKMPLWQRLLAPLVEIQPLQNTELMTQQQRTIGLNALQMEFTLANAAIQNNNQKNFEAALLRMDDWLMRLWPDTPELQHQRDGLAKLRNTPLQVNIPLLGTTLQQLRSTYSSSAVEIIPPSVQIQSDINNQIKADQIKTDEIPPNEIKSDDIKTDEVKPETPEGTVL